MLALQDQEWLSVLGKSVWPRLSETEQALFRSQSGPTSGLPFSSVPFSPPTRFAPHLFRVLLLRRLWLALPLSSRTCRCGRPLDVLGHHRAACSRAGVLGSGGSPWRAQRHESAVKPELGSPTNLFVRDLDLPIANHDARRLEVVADGLPLFGGAQLAIDTTLVSSVQADGRPRPQCARVDGAALSESPPTQAAHVPGTLWDSGSRKVGGIGRRGGEAVGLTKPVLLSVSWPRPKPGQCLGCWLVVHVRRGNIGGHQCWLVRLLERFALSLLDKRPALGSDGDTPSSSDVVAACRHLPLSSTL